MLEQQLASYLGVAHCSGVASGTDALVIALRALAIVRTGRSILARMMKSSCPLYLYRLR